MPATSRRGGTPEEKRDRARWTGQGFSPRLVTIGQPATKEKMNMLMDDYRLHRYKGARVRLDLNLLRYLDALLEERSVSKAAERLGLSQPSLSAALARLRRHFGDQLLVRAGRSHELTPLATLLLERAGDALTRTEQVFNVRSDFDPAQAEREFVLILADTSLPTIGRTLTDLVREQAPGVRLRFQQSTEHTVTRGPDLLRTVDGMLLPQGLLAAVPSVDLYQDRWMYIASADHPAAASGLTAPQLGEAPWVVSYYHPPIVSPPLRHLLDLGHDPRIAVATESFLALPYLVVGTDRLALITERLARLLPAGSGTVALEFPFTMLPLVEALWWHPVHERDPAHIWLRHICIQAGRNLDMPAPP
jgi:DNA-binding transcriptional LysR family regulator